MQKPQIIPQTQRRQGFSPSLRPQRPPQKYRKSPQIEEAQIIEYIEDKPVGLLLRAVKSAALWLVCSVERQADKAKTRRKYSALQDLRRAEDEQIKMLANVRQPSSRRSSCVRGKCSPRVQFSVHVKIN